MNPNETATQETGLEFFGTLSAAVSHDLKNVLSIINEKAGLLEDFCLMARRGRPLDAERIDALTAQVKEQVARADQIIRGFNRFAHCVDHPIIATDVGETVANLVRLAQRLLAGLQVAVVVHPAKPPVVIATRPLLVQKVVWMGIQWAAVRLANEDRDIFVDITGAPSGNAVVRIGPVAEMPAEGVDAGLRASTRLLCDTLSAELDADPATATLLIRFAPLKAP